MSTLDKINEMRSQGYDDSSIANSLQEMGISPREINDALAQSRIKEAVSDYDLEQGMEPSVMNQEIEASHVQNYSKLGPMPQEGPNAREMEIPSPGMGEDYDSYAQDFQQEAEYPSGNYEQYNQGYGNIGPGTNPEMVSEVASQIFSEKMKKTKKEIEELTEFKILFSSKVEKIDSRLNRIEGVIDQLQTSLLRKASEQEQNIKDIKTEIIGMEEGFSKVLNPLIDIERGMEKPRLKSRVVKRKTKKR